MVTTTVYVPVVGGGFARVTFPFGWNEPPVQLYLLGALCSHKRELGRAFWSSWHSAMFRLSAAVGIDPREEDTVLVGCKYKTL